MTKLAELEKAAEKFKTTVQAKIKSKTGGSTWTKVKAVADRVPAAILPQIGQIELMLESKDPADRAKVPGYFKTLKAQFKAVDLEPVRTYIKEHNTGGAKSRTKGVAATLGLNKAAQAAEAERVKLAAELIKQYGLMQIMLNQMSEKDL